MNTCTSTSKFVESHYWLKHHFLIKVSFCFLLLSLCSSQESFALDKYVKLSSAGLSAPFDGSSWDHPLIGFAGIKTAFEANNNVFVAAGVYTSTSSLSKSSGSSFFIQGGFSANATGTDKSGYDPVVNLTTIDGVDTYKIFGGTVGVASFTVKGIKFYRSYGASSAGGVFCAAGPATQQISFTDCVFLENKTNAGYAGVAYVASVTGNTSFIKFINCVFNGNQSQHHGGALGFSTVYSNNNTNTGAFLIEGCSFVNNQNDGSGDDEGGAIYFTTSHGWTIKNSSFCSNTATLRGGAMVFTTSHDNTISGCSFSSNTLFPSGNLDGDGGAIYVTTGAVDISESTFKGNTINTTSSNLGGAIYGTTALLGISNTTFADNTGGLGGAVYGTTTSFTISGTGFYNNKGFAGGGLMNTTWYNSNNPSTITNSIFFGNQATSTETFQDAGRRGGGAMCLDANANNWAITNTKFVNNKVPANGWGGAISIYDLNVTIDGSLFYNNTKGGSATVDGSDLKNYNTAGAFAINTTKVQLANAALYTNQISGSDYGFGSGNTFGNTDKGGITNLAASTISCPVNVTFVSVAKESGTAPATGGTAISSVISNDMISGSTVVLGQGGNAVLTESGSWPAGLILNVTTGAVMVASGTIPGVYNVTYQLCDLASNCSQMTDQVTVTGVSAPAADNGSINSSGGIAIPNVRSNDSVNGLAATSANSDISLVNTTLTGLTLDPATGAVTVPSGSLPGNYTFLYQLCEKSSPTVCNTASGNVQVTNQNPVANTVVFTLSSQLISGQSVALDGLGTNPTAPNGTDPENGALGGSTTTSTLVISTLPSNGELYYNAGSGPVLVTLNQEIMNFDARKLTFKVTGSGYSTTTFSYAFKDSNGALSPGASYKLSWSTGPLPVKLIGFTAIEEGNTTQLNWSTASEINSDYFQIQHSQNAKDWVEIGVIFSLGESSVVQGYSFVDNLPLQGINYYRLKMVDKDGTYTYSRLQSVELEMLARIEFYPNPVSETLFFNKNVRSKLKSISIIDVNGRIVYKSLILPSSGINVKGFASGIYVVRITSESGAQYTQKIVVNR